MCLWLEWEGELGRAGSGQAGGICEEIHSFLRGTGSTSLTEMWDCHLILFSSQISSKWVLAQEAGLRPVPPGHYRVRRQVPRDIGVGSFFFSGRSLHAVKCCIVAAQQTC